MDSIVKIGLTGGIASGKSLVAKLLKHQGILVVDMDQLSRDLLDTNPMLQKEVIEWMGSGILTDGKIDRLKLRKLIFSDPNKRKQLESLIHPKVRNSFERIAKSEHDKGKRLIVCEAALLLEGGYFKSLDRLIVVLCPEDVRKSRLLERDKISLELIDQMLRAQVGDEERLKHATYVLRNDSSPANLEKQVTELVSSWRKEGLI